MSTHDPTPTPPPQDPDEPLDPFTPSDYPPDVLSHPMFQNKTPAQIQDLLERFYSPSRRRQVGLNIESRAAEDLNQPPEFITTELPEGRIGVIVRDPVSGEWTFTTYDPSTGQSRGPTQAELEIMRGQLEVQRGQLEENIRSNKAQEGLFLAELGISKETLEETIRSALVREEENQRDRALTAAANALDGYLRSAQLSDARRLASLQMKRDFLPFMVDPDREYFGGGPEGALAKAMAGIGLPYTPTKIQHQTVNPDALSLIDPTIGANITSALEDVTVAGQPEGLYG